LIASAAGAEPPSARRVATLPGFDDSVLQFSIDGKLLLAAGSKDVRVFEAATLRQLIEPIRQEGLAAAQFVQRTSTLLTLGYDARLWDVRTGKQIGDAITVAPLRKQDDDESWGVAGWSMMAWPAPASPANLSGDGARVAVTSAIRAPNGRTDWQVEVWDVSPRKRIVTLRHDLRPGFVRFSPDGRTIVTAEPFDQRPHGGGENFHLWDLTTGAEVCPLIRTDYNYNVDDQPPAAFSPDGALLAIGSKNGFALYDGRSGQWLAGRRPLPDDGLFGSGPELLSLAFNADGRRILAQYASHFQLWDAARCKPIGEATHGFDAAFSNDGRSVLAVRSADPDLQVTVWDADTGQNVGLFGVGEHSSISSITLSPDGRRVAVTYSASGDTGIWELPARNER